MVTNRKQKTIKKYSYTRNGKRISVRKHKRHYNYAEKVAYRRISKKDAEKVMQKRSRTAISTDRRQSSRKLYDNPNSVWASNPSKTDVKGIDDKQKEKLVIPKNATRCLGITTDGTRCKNTTLNENGYCPTHQDQQNYKSYERRTRIPPQKQIVLLIEGIEYNQKSIQRSYRILKTGSERAAIVKRSELAIKAQKKALKDLLPAAEYYDLQQMAKYNSLNALQFNNKYYRSAKNQLHKSRPKYDDIGKQTSELHVGEYINTKDGMARIDSINESKNELQLQEMYNWRHPPKQKIMKTTGAALYVYNKDVVEEDYMKTTGQYLSKRDQNNIKFGKHF